MDRNRKRGRFVGKGGGEETEKDRKRYTYVQASDRQTADRRVDRQRHSRTETVGRGVERQTGRQNHRLPGIRDTKSRSDTTDRHKKMQAAKQQTDRQNQKKTDPQASEYPLSKETEKKT